MPVHPPAGTSHVPPPDGVGEREASATNTSPFEDPDGRMAARAGHLKVPLVDDAPGGRVYSDALLRWALVGAAVGALLLGFVGALVAYGNLPVAGLGPFSAAGSGVAVTTSGGVGLAFGGLAGALLALYKLPKRQPPSEHAPS